jgi:hypothetical protein
MLVRGLLSTAHNCCMICEYRKACTPFAASTVLKLKHVFRVELASTAGDRMTSAGHQGPMLRRATLGIGANAVGVRPRYIACYNFFTLAGLREKLIET